VEFISSCYLIYWVISLLKYA